MKNIPPETNQIIFFSVKYIWTIAIILLSEIQGETVHKMNIQKIEISGGVQ
jgi:hypothetical protein